MLKTYSASLRQIEDWHRNYTIPKRQRPNIMSLSIRLPAGTDRNRLSKAYSLLVRHHEVLRTSFPVIDGRIRQQIAEYDDETFGLWDTDRDDSAPFEDLCDRVLAGLKNLRRVPLIRGFLWSHHQELHFVFFIHHIISDQWSLEILRRDLTLLYRQLECGKEGNFPAEPLSYGVYIESNKQSIDARHLENLAYWQEKLADKAWQVDFDRLYRRCLPPEIYHSKRQKFPHWRALYQSHLLKHSTGQRYLLWLDEELARGLNRLKDAFEVTLYGVLIASLHLLGAKVTGSNRLLIATHFSNRHDPQTDLVIGNLLGSVLLYGRVDPGCTLREFVLRSYRDFLAAIDRMLYNSEKLERLQFSTRCFLHFNFITSEAPPPGRSREPVTEDANNVISPLFCEAVDYGNTLQFKWGYHLWFLDSELIKVLTDEFKKLLAKMIECPDADIAGLFEL